MSPPTARRGPAFLALLAALVLLLQPFCIAWAQAQAAPHAAASRHDGGAGGHRPLHPVPGRASCCTATSVDVLAAPPTAPQPHAVPLTALHAGTQPVPRSVGVARARVRIAWAEPPPPLPYHSRTGRILR